MRTKLYAPAQPTGLVVRAGLLERLEASKSLPLALVSAPAGYGKSLLISSWLEQCNWTSAWLSLDESDGDLRANGQMNEIRMSDLDWPCA